MTKPPVYNPFLGFESSKVAEEEAKANEVPTGTVPEILEWVDGDKEKAERALKDEESNSKPRKGLVKELKEIIGD